VTYLEMARPDELRPARAAKVAFEVRRAEIPCAELSRFLYTAVGGDWLWTDRLHWTYAEWLAWVTRPGYELWMAYVADTPAGYFELQGLPGEDVELAFFGLLPQSIGCGLGGALLTRAVERAWAKPARRVWVHTSSFDHPAALNNYRARGFRVVRTETNMVEKPAAPIGPWPGAARTPDVTMAALDRYDLYGAEAAMKTQAP
jgi:ribosomal protein S18 acetylase RimI-like enzyme